MKNQTLFKLNFSKVLRYPTAFPVREHYDEPIRCRGFCTLCESKAIFQDTGYQLTLMSHGCDLSDYEAVLGPLKSKRKSPRAMFLLESPGGDYDLGEDQSFKEVTKKPPLRHYYWAPSCRRWPESESDFDGNPYGTYFAYLMKRFGFEDVYITNMIKCKLEKTAKGPVVFDMALIYDLCVRTYLDLEIESFRPSIILAFGAKAYHLAVSRYDNIHQLLHPSFMKDRYQTQSQYTSYWHTVMENDSRIDNSLKGM